MKRVSANIASLLVIVSLFPFSSINAANVEGEQPRNELRTEMTERGRAASEEIIVKYKGADSFQVEKLSRGQSVRDSVRAFQERTDVEYAEPNYIAEAYMTPNDQYFGYQWSFSQIGMPAAWDVSNGANTIVAIVDTGIAYENFSLNGKNYALAPDLANTAFVPGYDFYNNDAHPNDDHGHGTHVAGTIAQSTNNAVGAAGIAYGAKIMPLKALSATGVGTYAAVANSIRFAADNGAHVINMSLGGQATSQALQDAVQYAHSKGVTIVAASGNENLGTVGYPAAYDCCVIAVGATRYDKTRAPYSNWGTSLDIVAPGGDTKVDQNGDGYNDGILQQTFSGNNYGTFGYYFFQGTSMASPHVAGVAALLIAKGTATTPADVREALLSTADDLGTPGRDNTFGYGLLDAVGALAWGSAPIESPQEPPQPVEPPPPPTEVDVFADSFEVSEWNGLWVEDSQNDWFRSTQRATAGIRSAEVDGNANNASLTTNALNLQGKTNATITFSWLIESGLDTNEYVTFDISTDGGTTWTERARLSGNVSQENAWHATNISVNDIANLKLRFRGKMSDSTEDANVDNVKVVAF